MVVVSVFPQFKAHMVDTQRIQNAPQCISGVAQVAALRAKDLPKGQVHVLDVVTYVPLDVESVSRMLESLTDREDIEKIQQGDFCVIDFEDPHAFYARPMSLEDQEHLKNNPSLLKNLTQLRQDEHWVRKVKIQHELLRLVARSKKKRVDIEFFTRQCDLPSVKIQSTLNDLTADGHIVMEVDERADKVFYTFPPFEYPKKRYQNNMTFLEDLPTPVSSRVIVLSVMAVLLALAVFGLVWRM